MTPRILVTSQGPLSAGSIVFRDIHGQFVCTIVAKITYSLGSGIVAPVDEPLPIQEEDGHWDDDSARSVHVPSDLVPFKKAPEVVVVGSAFAPKDQPVSNIIARVIVGSVDKSVEAHAPRFLRDGGIEEGPRARRFPLRYEYAAGGPDTDNPMGMDISRPDGRGRRSIPQLLPVACEVNTMTNHLPPIGLGPLPATFRTRSEELRLGDRAWLADPAREALPLGFPTNYFQSAPADQWLTRPLAANERVVLENLHQRHARLVMTLSGLEPVAVVLGHAEPLRLRGDLLVIDSDRALCTLTFRGHLPIGDTRGVWRVVVVTTPMGTTLGPEQIQNIVQLASGAETLGEDDFDEIDDSLDTTRDISPEDFEKIVPTTVPNALPFSGAPPLRPPPSNKRQGTITTLTPMRRDGSVSQSSPSFPEKPLPFATPAPQPIRQPSYPDGMLAPPPSPPSPAIPPAMVNVGRVLGAPNALRTPPSPASIASQPVAQTPIAPAPQKPWAEIPSTPLPVEPAKPVSLMAGLRARDTNAPSTRTHDGQTGSGANVLSVQGASDAAAHDEKARDVRSGPQHREAPSRNSTTSVRRLAVVDLLTFEPKIAPRLRSMKRLTSLWAAIPKTKSPLSPDEPQRLPPDPDREIVLRVLSCAEGQVPADIRRALGESLDDLSDLDPPLVLCAGELVPKFDDLDALRVSVAVASSVAGTDKRMLSTIAVAQEALSATLPPAPETLRNLAKQIETASGTLNVPPRFLANHVERILVENRNYKRRMILGALRVRADLVFAGGDVFPLYLLDDAAKSLPLLPSFPVTAVCEVRPREDMAEAQTEALLCMALGRVLYGRPV